MAKFRVRDCEDMDEEEHWEIDAYYPEFAAQEFAEFYDADCDMVYAESGGEGGFCIEVIDPKGNKTYWDIFAEPSIIYRARERGPLDG